MFNPKKTRFELVATGAQQTSKKCFIDELPNEILGRIFALASSETKPFLDPKDSRDAVKKYSEPVHRNEVAHLFSPQSDEHLFSLVCRRWRAVALSEPGLKTFIPLLEFHTLTEAGMERSLARVQHMITRSLNHPLTIRAAIGYTDCERSGGGSYPELTFQNVVEMTTAVQQRCEHIQLVSYDKAGLPIQSSSLSFKSLPQLKTLALQFPTLREAPDPSKGEINVDVSSCQQLQRFFVNGKFKIVSNGTHLKDLTHVEIGQRGTGHCPYTVRTGMMFLKIAQNIETLKLNVFPTGINFTELGRSEFIIPTLKCLVLDSAEKTSGIVRDLSNFIDRLTAPSLEHLEVEVIDHLDVIGLVQRSNCKIRYISLDGTRFYNDTHSNEPEEQGLHVLDAPLVVTSWLRGLPDLEQLVMDRIELWFITDFCLPRKNGGGDEIYGNRDRMDEGFVTGSGVSDFVGDGMEVDEDDDEDDEDEDIDMSDDGEVDEEAFEDIDAIYGEPAGEAIHPGQARELCRRLTHLTFRNCILKNKTTNGFIDMLENRMSIFPGSEGHVVKVVVEGGKLGKVPESMRLKNLMLLHKPDFSVKS